MRARLCLIYIINMLVETENPRELLPQVVDK